MGNLEGLFIATDKEVADIVGKRVYFGEVLGKHSEIYGELEMSDFTKITDEPLVVAILESNVGSKTISGYSPFDYLEG